MPDSESMYSTAVVKSIAKRVVPDSLLFTTTPPLVSAYARLVTWYAYGRYYQTRIDPFEIVYIDPFDVDQIITVKGREYFQYSDAVSEVIGGDWDKHVLELEEYDLYKAFVDHFENGCPWKKTDFYDRAQQIFHRGEQKWGCKNITEFENRLRRIDDLFRAIETEGYKSQSELRQESRSDPALRRIHQYWPPKLHEIALVISRDGSLIAFEGRHRLSIARILNISEIPVRIKGRHKLWQKYREELNNSSRKELITSHPDFKQ